MVIYAYSGGGRKITRVEITFDDGENWILCEFSYPDGVPRHGRKYVFLHINKHTHIHIQTQQKNLQAHTTRTPTRIHFVTIL